MAGDNRLRILYLLKILWEETDEEHALKTTEIIEELESDVDFFILLKCSHDELLNYRHAIVHISSEVSLDHDMEVSIMMEDKRTYEKWMDALYFYKNVWDEGVMLYAG